MDATDVVLAEIAAERDRQNAKWGEQNHPSVSEASSWLMMDERLAKKLCELAAQNGELTWVHIAVEELAEAIDAQDEAARRGELVQLAAVITAWVECIDRRQRASAQITEGGDHGTG